jgi:hypothetical protein
MHIINYRNGKEYTRKEISISLLISHMYYPKKQ